MSATERLVEKARQRRRKIIKLWGEEVICLTHPISKVDKLVESAEKGNEHIISFISSQFIDPETDAPVFTPEFLRDEMSSGDLKELIKIFFQANGAGGIDISEKEKN